MPLDIYLYPGVDMHVTAPTKITMTPLAPGEVPPAGASIIPPQTAVAQAAMAGTIHAAAIANLEVARQGMEAAQALTNQQTAEAHAAFESAVTQSNEAAAKLVQSPSTPPWTVTFTEKK